MSSRRDFLFKSLCAASLMSLLGLSFKEIENYENEYGLKVNVFSKQLQFLDYETTGQIAKELGFSGVDLTVRPNGHVLPKSVKEDFPKAIEQIKSSGSNCEIITTNITSIDSLLDIDVMKIAAQCSIKYFRTNWFKYQDGKTMVDSLKLYQKNVDKLASFSKSLGLVGCYQNHAGTNIGASFWEIKKMIETADPDYFGLQYDIRHAMVEGGLSWENGLKLLHRNIKTIVLKDFKWKQVKGKWQAVHVPIGEGMVDFLKYFKLLKYYGLNPPASLHVEYDLGGAEKGEREILVDKKVVFNALKRDLNKIQQIWKQA